MPNEVALRVATRRLGEEKIEKAIRLRKLNLSYRAIGVVMGEFYGVYHCADWWTRVLRFNGATHVREPVFGAKSNFSHRRAS